MTFQSKTATSAGGLPIRAWVRQKNEDGANPDLEVRASDGVVRLREEDVGEKRFYFPIRSGETYTLEVTNDTGSSHDFDLVARWHAPRPLQPVGAGSDQRWYVETMEFIREKMVEPTPGDNEPNVPNWERIYTDQDPPGLYAFDDGTPRRYHDGTPLPRDLRDYNGFTWDGGTGDIEAAFDDGRFLIVHRDHGWGGGWASPRFARGNVPSIDNEGQLPIVFSINCDTGRFANEANPDIGDGVTYFAERLVRDGPGGAVAAIAPVRLTGTHTNNQIAKGLFDAIWPDVLPGYGSSREKDRLGDVFLHGLVYMMKQRSIPSPGADPNYAAKQLAYYQIFGDPSLWVRTGPPVRLDEEFDTDRREDRVDVDFGTEADLAEIRNAVVTAFQRDDREVEPIGRATVEGRSISVDYENDPDDGAPVELAVVTKDGTSKLLGDSLATTVPIADESSFTGGATRIDFDGVDVGATIDAQYTDRGVTFVEPYPDLQTLRTVDMTNRDNAARSSPQAVLHEVSGSPPGDDFAPVVMRFSSPVQRVGLYVGNAIEPLTVLLEAYDEQGRLLAAQTVVAPYDIAQFVGFEADAAAIAEVHLRYEFSSGGEIFDDLVFE
jgi:hypothetical protein